MPFIKSLFIAVGFSPPDVPLDDHLKAKICEKFILASRPSEHPPGQPPEWSSQGKNLWKIYTVRSSVRSTGVLMKLHKLPLEHLISNWPFTQIWEKIWCTIGDALIHGTVFFMFLILQKVLHNFCGSFDYIWLIYSSIIFDLIKSCFSDIT